ncbi:MAG: hypothetical protein JJ939_11480 [Alphaproteobacteria bacterium]|nr:hypothetical protein [Alphaproteobacteria bacterium]MBO6629036.1 hypothetical protein [Alphaproteobacteria bacterium]
MSRRPALFTETDARRAMKAAEQMGWKSVTLEIGDGVKVHFGKEQPEKPVEEYPEIVL